MDDKLDLAQMAEQIAAAVRRLRKARGWTQEQLADQIHAHRSTIHLVEKGDRDHDHKTIQAIADAFGVAIGEITGETEESSELSRDALRVGRLYDSIEQIEDKAAAKRVVESFAAKRASS